MESSQILVSIFGLLFCMVLNSMSAGVTVHVDYQVEDVSPKSLPDELNATIVDESGRSTFLQLQRAKHIVPNIPVYTLNVDDEGKFFSRREILQETQNVGYYQDVSVWAALQVERMEASEEKNNDFILRGEVIIAGQNYKLDHGPSPGKREVGAAPSSEYSLELIPAVSASEIDFINPSLETLEHPDKVSSKFMKTSATGYTPSATSHVQRQTSGPTDVYVDVVAVADYAVYKIYRNESRPKDKDLNTIREHISYISNGINVRFRNIKSSKYNIHVRLARLIIAETAAASFFTEDYKMISDGEEYIEYGDSVGAFADFTVGAGKNVIFPRDHAMLFSGYDLASRKKETGEIYLTSVAGVAYGDGVCGQDRTGTSLNEYWKDYRSAPIAAHELGHNLGANHDGNGNNCSRDNGNIMSSLDNSNPNSFFFSNCSVSSMEEYISKKMNNENSKKCFLEQMIVSPDIPDVSNRLPGQNYTLDEQCKMFHYNDSEYCTEFGQALSDLCMKMLCRKHGSRACIYYQALPGTTCGNGKICLEGKCLSDPRAPTAKGNSVDNLGKSSALRKVP